MFFDVFRWLRKIPVAFLIYCYILLIYRYLIYNLKVLASSKSLIEGFILNFLYYTTNNEVKNLNSTLERRLISITSKINIREQYNLSSINLFKVNNKSTKTICEICLKLTNKDTSRQWRRSGVFIVTCEQISHNFCCFHCWF